MERGRAGPPNIRLAAMGYVMCNMSHRFFEGKTQFAADPAHEEPWRNVSLGGCRT
ncbi:hypothetical protein GCM10010404_55530 [Nonomuraea africana]|uniref:Uncharacterized protein n=1 Tax=Nonomuraea africana TaxID=46171 RepID=A0ABR9KU40_9ACTN|nr:hypothetical protein [Nonomuraea africana]